MTSSTRSGRRLAENSRRIRSGCLHVVGRWPIREGANNLFAKIRIARNTPGVEHDRLPVRIFGSTSVRSLKVITKVASAAVSIDADRLAWKSAQPGATTCSNLKSQKSWKHAVNDAGPYVLPGKVRILVGMCGVGSSLSGGAPPAAQPNARLQGNDVASLMANGKSQAVEN